MKFKFVIKSIVCLLIFCLEDFIKHLNNEALQKNVTDRARDILNKDVNTLISILQRRK